MTDAELKKWKDKIDEMSHLQMATFYRFAPSQHEIIQTPELWKYFDDRFKAAGGMTPAVSKSIEWNIPKI